MIFPLSCKREISHILVEYSAMDWRSSASSRLFWLHAIRYRTGRPVYSGRSQSGSFPVPRPSSLFPGSTSPGCCDKPSRSCSYRHAIPVRVLVCAILGSESVSGIPLFAFPVETVEYVDADRHPVVEAEAALEVGRSYLVPVAV